MSGLLVTRPQLYTIDDGFYKPRIPCLDANAVGQAYVDQGIVFAPVKLLYCNPCSSKPVIEAGSGTQYGTIVLYWIFPVQSATIHICKKNNDPAPRNAVIECFKGTTEVHQIPLTAGCIHLHPTRKFDTVRISTFNQFYIENVSYEAINDATDRR